MNKGSYRYQVVNAGNKYQDFIHKDMSYTPGVEAFHEVGDLGTHLGVVQPNKLVFDSSDTFTYQITPSPEDFVMLRCLNPDEPTVVDTAEGDMVNQPDHYQIFRGIEAKDIMEVVAESKLCDGLSPWEIHCFLTSLKYRLRAGSKDDLKQDIDKAERYKACLK